MDVVKEFYEYTVRTKCGIPWVDLWGSEDDWTLLAGSLDKALPTLGLSGWNSNLQKIFDNILATYQGQTDLGFWKQIYRYHGPSGSGGVAKVDGWLAQLFLHIRTGENALAVGGRADPLDELDSVTDDSETDSSDAYKNEFPRSESKTPWTDEKFWQTLRPKASPDFTLATSAPPKPKVYTSIPLADFGVGLTKTPFIWNYYGAELPMTLRAGLVGVTQLGTGALSPEVGWVIGRRDG